MALSQPPTCQILMIHGFTQNGSLFRAKTRALEKAILKNLSHASFSYPDAPGEMDPADIPGFVPSAEAVSSPSQNRAWWWRTENTPHYRGMEDALNALAKVIRDEGPFDGVIGFSQGGAAAAMVASLLEPGRKEAFDAFRADTKLPQSSSLDHDSLAFPPSFLNEDGNSLQAPLKFALVYSGFRAPPELYQGFYDPPIATRTLHFLGSLDTVVSEERSQALVDVCRDGTKQVLVHPGGHFVPSQKAFLDAAVGFILDCMRTAPASEARM